MPEEHLKNIYYEQFQTAPNRFSNLNPPSLEDPVVNNFMSTKKSFFEDSLAYEQKQLLTLEK